MFRLKQCLAVLIMLSSFSIVSATVWEISPWTDDASTGIDYAKTYTHTINNTSGAAAIINGIVFTNSWGTFDNGSLDGTGYIDSDTNNDINGGSYNMSTHFRYTNSLLKLTGLTPGAQYEITLFSVAWEDGTRTVTLTDNEDSFVFNQDEYGNNNGIKIVGVYTADANGEYNLSLVNDFHLYGFANCEYLAAIKTTSPDIYFGGNRVSQGSDFTWEELFPGFLTNPVFDIYMDPNETKVAEMDPSTLISSKQTEFSFTPSLDYGSVYYWRVAAYVDAEDLEPTVFSKVVRFMTEYEEEHWSDSAWIDDTTSDISVGKIYTHKVNFNANETFSTEINGVDFENDSDRVGDNWTLDGAVNGTGGTHHVLGDGGTLVSNMYYGPDAVMTLTGLTPGENYIMTQYTRGWGNSGIRKVLFHTSVDDRVTLLDGNYDGDGNGRLFKYAYTAPASGKLVITFDPVNSNDTWHHYAFSNEIASPAYVDPIPQPNTNVDANSELSWTLHGDAVSPSYTVTVASDPNLYNVVDSTTTTATSFSPNLQSNVNYYWQIVIEDGGSVIYTSPVWPFITTPPVLADKVIEWKFDETSGTIAYQTAATEDADGLLTGFNDPDASQNVAGIDGAGLRLNGLDEYVDVSDGYVYMPTGDEQAFAISGYIRTFDDYGPIFSMRKNGNETPLIDLCLGHDGSQALPGGICLLVRDDNNSLSGTTSGITVNDGAWHSFVVSRSEGKWSLYVDGLLRGTMANVASGSLTLDWLAIGSSIEWNSSDWNPELPYYRNFEGIVDEFVVWKGEILPQQIVEMASKVPAKTDLDGSMSTDIDDLNTVAVNWLTDTKIDVQDNINLADFEGYDKSDPNAMDGYWMLPPERIGEEYGTSTFSIVDDPNGDEGQVLQWDYTFNTMPYVHSRYILNERRLDVNLYDTIQFVVKKLPGASANTFIVDIFDGRNNVDPLTDGLHYRGRLDLDISTVPVDNWVVIERAIPTDFTRSSAQYCHDLFQFDFYISNGGGTGGPVQIAQINLLDSSKDCMLTAGETVSDINGDCMVNLVDLSILAENWLE